MTPVILAALKEELAPLRRVIDPDVARFVRTGVGPRRAAAAVRERCRDADLIISSGCCGGLVPGAARGMLAIPARVLRLASGEPLDAPAPDASLAELARGVAERLGLHCSPRPLVTVEDALHTPESKHRCHEACGAVVVDMETAAVAEAAREINVPYLSIRVVLDTADETLPRIPKGLVEAVRRPGEMLTLAALALRLRSVSADLGGCIAALLHELGC